jgi:hypothetical protein
MRRTAPYIAAVAMGFVATGMAATTAEAQAPTCGTACDVATEILTGGPIALDNAEGLTALGELIPFSGEFRFQQTVDLVDPPGDVNEPEQNRLFKHDYSFTIPVAVSGAGGEFDVQDIPNNLSFQMGLPLIDIRQLTAALFDDGGPGGGGALLDPPGVVQVLNPDTRISTIFSGLPAGDYTLRVAGILNGFDVDTDWHGEYQANIAITPLPGAVWFFVSAIGGLVWFRRRRLQAA